LQRTRKRAGTLPTSKGGLTRLQYELLTRRIKHGHPPSMSSMVRNRALLCLLLCRHVNCTCRAPPLPKKLSTRHTYKSKKSGVSAQLRHRYWPVTPQPRHTAQDLREALQLTAQLMRVVGFSGHVGYVAGGLGLGGLGLRGLCGLDLSVGLGPSPPSVHITLCLLCLLVPFLLHVNQHLLFPT
jgi:hypothetical protein